MLSEDKTAYFNQYICFCKNGTFCRNCEKCRFHENKSGFRTSECLKIRIYLKSYLIIETRKNFGFCGYRI